MERKGVINIESVRLDQESNTIRLIYKVAVENKVEEIYYQLNSEYLKTLSYEVSDGIIVTLLPYAMRGGYDITTNIPMSKKLFYGLSKQLIPQLVICSSDCYRTCIYAPLTDKHYNPNGIATAISCGVDSFATLKEYTCDCQINGYKLTHLTFYENGAHHLDKIGFSLGQKELYQAQAAAAKQFCQQFGYQLILIESNVNEILSVLFWNDSFEFTHTYRNIGFTLLLQKLLKTYYYSAGYNLDAFHLSLQSDPAKYERFLLPCCCTENTSFFSSNEGMTRLEKTQYITDFDQTYDHLLVCYMRGSNCGKCKKCKRTLLTLDSIGKLEVYKNSFDLREYNNDRISILGEMLLYKKTDEYLGEIWQYRKGHGLKTPFAAYSSSLKMQIRKKLITSTAIKRLYPIYKFLFRKR